MTREAIVRCERVVAALSSHLDARLAPRSARAIEEHLVRCAACRGEFELLRELGRGARALPDAPLEAGLGERVRARVQAGAPLVAPWMVGAAAAVVLAVACSVAFELGRQRGRSDPRSDPRSGAFESSQLAQATNPDDAPLGVQGDAAGVADAGPLENGDPRGDALGGDEPEAPLTSRIASLPTNAEAMRVARSVLADLEILDELPTDMRAPLMRAQLELHGLDRWARELDPAAPGRAASEPEVHLVAQLVRSLEASLDRPDDDQAFARLRERAGASELWGSLALSDPSSVVLRQVPPAREQEQLDQLVDELAAELDAAARRSMSDWIEFKRDWLRDGGDAGELASFVGTLGPDLGSSRAMPLPDLSGLLEGIEWSIDVDGVRRGELDLEALFPGRAVSGGATLYQFEMRVERP